MQCSNNWYVTGYDTAAETEFSFATQLSVRVTKVGSVSPNKAFIGQVKIEVWGKTRFGWYPGYYPKAWYRSPVPLDAKGGTLRRGTIATDPGVIANGRSVTIPGLYPMI